MNNTDTSAFLKCAIGLYWRKADVSFWALPDVGAMEWKNLSMCPLSETPLSLLGEFDCNVGLTLGSLVTRLRLTSEEVRMLVEEGEYDGSLSGADVAVRLHILRRRRLRGEIASLLAVFICRSGRSLRRAYDKRRRQSSLR